jgi:type I restriction enzyme R subunit/putative DNA methylase
MNRPISRERRAPARPEHPEHPSLQNPSKGWYWRGYLPHFDNQSVWQSITFRLADSLPQNKLQQLENELSSLPKEKQDLHRRKTIETWLDTGMGCCALKHSQMDDVVQETFLRFDGEKYRLLAWCIMPN